MKWVSEYYNVLYVAMENGCQFTARLVVKFIYSYDLFCDICAFDRVMRLFNKDERYKKDIKFYGKLISNKIIKDE